MSSLYSDHNSPFELGEGTHGKQVPCAIRDPGGMPDAVSSWASLCQLKIPDPYFSSSAAYRPRQAVACPGITSRPVFRCGDGREREVT